jgi:hypothetical protein
MMQRNLKSTASLGADEEERLCAPRQRHPRTFHHTPTTAEDINPI